MVSAMNFGSEGQWFDAWSLPSCCFLRKKALLHVVLAFSIQVYKCVPLGAFLYSWLHAFAYTVKSWSPTDRVALLMKFG